MGKQNESLKHYKWVRRNLSIEINPKPGWDIYIITIYLLGKRIGEIEIDGLELACAQFGHDEVGYKKLENEHKENL